MKRRISAAATDAVTARERENREISYQAALEGIVLLKNAGGALPVAPERIALYGAGASRTVKGGTGSGEVNERHAVSILEGLEQAGYEIATRPWIEDFERQYAAGYEAWRKPRGLGRDIINAMAGPYMPPFGRPITDEDVAASACDTAVYVVARQAGESADKRLDGEFTLDPAEIGNIEKMASAYTRSILVINSGSYMDIGRLDQKVSAVIWFCQQGMEGGRAFADILSGKVSPSGRLTDTWARTYDDIPFGDQYSYLGGSPEELYREGIYVGYRYFDTFSVAPRYPFGYGLSYTSFSITAEDAVLEGQTVRLTAAVTNTGGCPGKEVVQLYVSPPDGRLKKEYQRLIAFAKTGLLAPEETQRLELTFDVESMASYDAAQAAWLLEAGDYILRLGRSSLDTVPAAVVTLDADALVTQCRNICAPEMPIDEIHPTVRTDAAGTDSVPRLPLRAADIHGRTVAYGDDAPAFDDKVERVADRLSKEELAEVCVGSGMLGMLATNGVYAPGTVGRTTHKLMKKGLVNVNLADGPAGLRLLKVSGLTRRGGLRFVRHNYMLSALEHVPDGLMKLMEAKPGKHTLYYQFTTSFPVETALAQTWNEDLCRQVGRAVSREMEEYAITFWLAPALNIHKNPLCGRNFEYMSEDPLLTGKLAAAIVRGIQSIPGHYATIKHFACNNREDDRNRSDSRVNERALREIYLRAFEICVKEAAPGAVMTSYNKLNGTYTANSYDLCTAVLRNEWGFEGLVMTDWFSTGKGQADGGKAIAAGNDLLMPGMGSDKKSILRALGQGELSPEALRRSACRIIRAVLDSAVAQKTDPADFD